MLWTQKNQILQTLPVGLKLLKACLFGLYFHGWEYKPLLVLEYGSRSIFGKVVHISHIQGNIDHLFASNKIADPFLRKCRFCKKCVEYGPFSQILWTIIFGKPSYSVFPRFSSLTSLVLKVFVLLTPSLQEPTGREPTRISSQLKTPPRNGLFRVQQRASLKFENLTQQSITMQTL